ncbi:hypothetical protein PanWU01x14_132980, partial [Parasponia andersonii]
VDDTTSRAQVTYTRDPPTRSQAGITVVAVAKLPKLAWSLASEGTCEMEIRQCPSKEPLAEEDKVIDLAELHARQLY